MARPWYVPSPEKMAEDEKKYHENVGFLKDLFDSHQGQQVLVIETHEHIGGCTGFGGKGHLERNTSYKLGVPAGKATPKTSEDHSFSIPMPRYAQRGTHYTDRRWDLWERAKGPMTIGILEIVNLNKELDHDVFDRHPPRMEDLSSSLEVIAGAQNVALYFTVNKSLYDLVQAQRKDGKRTDEEMKEILETGYLDVQYVAALKMLDIKPLPEIKAKIEQRKQHLAGILVKQGYAGKPDEQSLAEAFLLGMHKEPGTFKEDGITVDVPEYIRKLCGKHKIEMPK